MRIQVVTSRVRRARARGVKRPVESGLVLYVQLKIKVLLVF